MFFHIRRTRKTKKLYADMTINFFKRKRAKTNWATKSETSKKKRPKRQGEKKKWSHLDATRYICMLAAFSNTSEIPSVFLHISK